MVFKGIEFDFDIYDADAAEDYEREAKALQDKADDMKKGENLAVYIRRQCEAIFTFFDNLLGDGTHRDLFGDRVNLRVCLEAVEEFKGIVEGQMHNLPTSATPTHPNRATRRAAERRKTPAKPGEA